MNDQIEIKDIAPTLMLTHINNTTFQMMEDVAYSIRDVAKDSIKGSFVCLCQQPFLKSDSNLELYCPVSTSSLNIDPKKFKFEVLQRTKVVSIIHTGEYNQLESAFQTLQTYIKENNFTEILPYRVIFHKEKRKWERRTFFKRAKNEYVTEVQVQFLESTEDTNK